MPITLVTTVGSASANSYATKAEADAIAAEVFPHAEVAAWDGADGSDDQLLALIAAAKLLDRERFKGDPVDTTQARAWPRWWVNTPNGGAYLATEVPALVKEAQARLAFFLVAHQDDASDVFGPADSAGLSSISIGSEISLSFEGGATSQIEGQRFLAQVIRPILGNLVYAPSAHAVRG